MRNLNRMRRVLLVIVILIEEYVDIDLPVRHVRRDSPPQLPLNGLQFAKHFGGFRGTFDFDREIEKLVYRLHFVGFCRKDARNVLDRRRPFDLGHCVPQMLHAVSEI